MYPRDLTGVQDVARAIASHAVAAGPFSVDDAQT
jgi:hypothetical protein